MLTTAQKIEKALAERQLQEKLAIAYIDYRRAVDGARNNYHARITAAGIDLEKQDADPVQG